MMPSRQESTGVFTASVRPALAKSLRSDVCSRKRFQIENLASSQVKMFRGTSVGGQHFSNE